MIMLNLKICTCIIVVLVHNAVKIIIKIFLLLFTYHLITNYKSKLFKFLTKFQLSLFYLFLFLTKLYVDVILRCVFILITKNKRKEKYEAGAQNGGI